jgi:hypothetical protein
MGAYLAVLSVASSAPRRTTSTIGVDASWSIVPSPNALGDQADNLLFGVACPNGADCWAVGYYLPRVGAAQTLIEHWDGLSWAVVPSPNTSSTQNNYLLAVACTSESDCWAVGVYLEINGGLPFYKTLIEHWDGTEWSIVESPNFASRPVNALHGVSCTSSSDCWAVGYYNNKKSVDQTLIEHWDGTSWTIVTSPNSLPTQFNYLDAVTCTSASNCWAVGSHSDAFTMQTLIVRWDGTSWAVVTSPNTLPTQLNYLSGVTCSSASSCWSVGQYLNSDSIYQTLIERWDGASWAIVTSPNTDITQDNFLAGVTCTAGSECWAVGTGQISGVYQTLIERWDGNSWAIVSSPNPAATQGNDLGAVTCLSATDCWAVGESVNDSFVNQTLVEHYAPTPTPTATPTSTPPAAPRPSPTPRPRPTPPPRPTP